MRIVRFSPTPPCLFLFLEPQLEALNQELDEVSSLPFSSCCSVYKLED